MVESEDGSKGDGEGPNSRSGGGIFSALRERGLRMGLATKLLGANALAIIVVAVVMLVQASTQLESSLRRSFESKGQAIALSLAAAMERSEVTGLTTVQGSIDANKEIDGVKYIYITDSSGDVMVHTFSPEFPKDLSQKNTISINEALAESRTGNQQFVVKVANVDYGSSGNSQSAIDVATPVAGGALGTVHVGMDPDQIQARVDELQQHVLLSGGIVAIAGIVLGLLLTLFSVVRPITELRRLTADIVRRGDLTQKIRTRSRDEVGQLAATFSQMLEKLREVPLSLGESAQLLTEAVGRLRETTNEQTEMVNRQAAALQEAQVTVQEIKQTSAMAAQKAEAVLQVAERADDISKSGEKAIEESLTALTDIRSEVEATAEKIGELTDRTRQIGLITETVKDLADQSNMLALNAAIEAVRSGEQGKGFGVVAREIRSLADQSIQATNRVREILDDISSAIRSTVQIAEKGAQRMEGGLSQVRVSGERLRELSGIVRDNSAAVRQIAAAVGQQNAGVAQIFAAVSDLNQMMEETIKRLDSTNESVDALSEVAERVLGIVGSFRV
jgi:methyl-accepting chemotaxis protein